MFEVVTGPVGRVARHAQNLLEVARFGGLVTGEEPAAYDVVQQSHHHRLRHYSLGLPADAPAIVLVPPLMVSTDVFDVSPQASAVRTLASAGVQSFVVDFGSPAEEPGGLERTIEDHILAVDLAIEHVRDLTGRDVHLAGYSQGGMFCYQAAAYRRSEGIASIVVFGSPVDLQGGALFRLPPALTQAAAKVASGALGGRSIPGWMTRLGFQALDPVGSVVGQLGFLWALHDREALLPREGQRRFLMKDGWVAFPGPALDYVIKQFVLQNRMLAGGFDVAGKAVSLADLRCPILTVVGEVDEIAPAPSVRAIRKAAPRAEVFELALRTGHFGLVVGSTAMERSWPAVAGWVRARDGLAELPEDIVSVPQAEGGPAPRERLEHNLDLAASLAESTGRRLAAGASSNPVPHLRRLLAPAAQVPRLVSLVGMRPHTQLSLGSAFDKAAARGAADVGFMYEGNVYNYAAINSRVDRIVRGLILAGVTPGEHVGILMDTRPTALALVTALNRIGAVAVILRPDGDTSMEARVGEVTRVIADPPNAAVAPSGVPMEVFLLEGGPTAVEGINTLEVREKIAMPEWLSRNPGRADDLAFVLFNGSGRDLRRIRVTNGRWALAAYGTASSGELSASDTLLSVSPLHHPAGLLTAIGGAIAGGTRIAWLSELDPATFWDEVRRYGVTVVSYTWSQMLPLVDAPPHPAERDHSIRLFLGSGMPRGLWRRIQERFAPAGVLEFWGSAERGAILANVSGVKVGSVGRPLPGAASVKLGRFDLTTRELVRGDDGLVVPAAAGELGLMLTQDRVGLFAEAAVTDVFATGDTWQPTASLFRRDADGDHWLEGMIHEIIDTAAGPVLPAPVAAVFEELPNATSAAAYPRPGKRGKDVVCVAVSVQRGLGPAAVTSAAWRLAEHERPAIVHVVPEMILSSAGRPAGTAIARMPIDLQQAWRWDDQREEYRPLSATALKRLLR